MIIVKDDKKYLSELDVLAIEKGIATLDIHSIRIDRYYTEEQKQENLLQSKSMTREEWSAHCNSVRDIVGCKVEQILTVLDSNLKIYQYKDETISYRDNEWDLFFWCNWTDSKRDLSYVTLSFNDKKTAEDRQTVLQTTLSLINEIELDGIIVYIQYKANYNKDKVEQIKKDFITNITDEFVNFQGMEGRFKLLGDNKNPEIAFFKKRVRNTYYKVDDKYILAKYLTTA